jgi:hypothetical protein
MGGGPPSRGGPIPIVHEDIMKIYGYKRKTVSDEGLLEMREITFCCAPEDLRAVGMFLLRSAREIKKAGRKFGHNHFRDATKKGNSRQPDVIATAIPPRRSGKGRTSKRIEP